MVVGDIIKRNAKWFGDKLAFKDEERTITFKHANERSNALLYGLMDLGIKKGGKVAVVLPNCVEYLEILFGLPKAGVVPVTLNWHLLGRELEYLINNSESETIILCPEVEEIIKSIRQRLDRVKNYIVVDRTAKSRSDMLNYEKLIESSPTAEIPVEVSESDIANILYSSGTTGRPKGIMLTNKNVMTNLINLGLELQPKLTDKFFTALPLFHVGGLFHAMLFFWFGCSVITRKKFDAKATLETINVERPSVVQLVPAMLNMVINHPDLGNYDLSCVDLMLYGGSPIALPQLTRAIEVFDCKFIQAGGLTEGTCVSVQLRPEDHVLEGPERVIRRLRSAGRALKLCEVKIVDEQGREVPPNTLGELVVKGDTVMEGYWKLPESTAETIVDGWLHTGDICMQDEDGYVYYVDRLKDMICRGGENIYPKEIEEVIATHPSVYEVAVIGVPDERLQEEIMALVVLKSGKTLTGTEIVDLCSQNLASYKRPRYVKFVEELPKTASGKVLKTELKREYKDSPLPAKIKI
jgi:acyl-CoA synthetase (AMP-forming)/AMP-acid ligase II